ncbi:hypothetical protein ACFX15_029580 [Malus domestica]
MEEGQCKRNKFEPCRPRSTLTPKLFHGLHMAIASPPSLTGQKAHSLPLEKAELFKSLEGWVEQHVLPFIKLVDQCWQPSTFLTDSTHQQQISREMMRIRNRGLAKWLYKLDEDPPSSNLVSNQPSTFPLPLIFHSIFPTSS